MGVTSWSVRFVDTCAMLASSSHQPIAWTACNLPGSVEPRPASRMFRAILRQKSLQVKWWSQVGSNHSQSHHATWRNVCGPTEQASAAVTFQTHTEAVACSKADLTADTPGSNCGDFPQFPHKNTETEFKNESSDLTCAPVPSWRSGWYCKLWGISWHPPSRRPTLAQTWKDRNRVPIRHSWSANKMIGFHTGYMKTV